MLTGRKKRSLIKFLNRSFPDAEEHFRTGSNGQPRYEWRYECPFCRGGDSSEKSFDMNVDNGVGRCWRQSCEWRGSSVSFVSEYLGVPWAEAKRILDSEEVVTVSSIRSELRNMEDTISQMYDEAVVDDINDIFVELDSAIPLGDSRIQDRVHDWISMERGYNVKEFLKCHDIWVPPQYNAWEDRVMFIVTTNDSVAYIMYSMNPNEKNKTLNPHGGVLSKMLYNYNNVKSSKIVFITEGIFDCARVVSWGYSAVASFGVALQAPQALLIDELSAHEICMCYDNDTEEVTLKAMTLLNSILSDDKRITVMNIEREGGDPDSLSEKAFLEYFKKRKKFIRDEKKVLKKTLGDIDIEGWY